MRRDIAGCDLLAFPHLFTQLMEKKKKGGGGTNQRRFRPTVERKWQSVKGGLFRSSCAVHAGPRFSAGRSGALPCMEARAAPLWAFAM